MKKFANMNEALAVATDRSKINTKEWRDAACYILDNAPPPLRARFDAIQGELMGKHFPELKPDHYDEQGVPYYSAASVQKALDMSDEEMNVAIADLKDCHPSHVTTADKLHRLQ